jgi:hypothetical protein
MRVIDVSIVPAEGILRFLGLWYSWQKCVEILFIYLFIYLFILFIYFFYNWISKREIICDINLLALEFYT